MPKDTSPTSSLLAAKNRLQPADFGGKEVDYPIDLPIKVIGLDDENYPKAIADICSQHGQQLTEKNFTQKASSGGKYLSLTFPFHAKSREHLDNFYRDIEAHPLVKWCL